MPATTETVPAHLREPPQLFVREGSAIVAAPEADVAVAREYATTVTKGEWRGQRRITLLTASVRVRIGQPVRVVHVAETTKAGDQLYVMGPKPVPGEHVDGVLRTIAAPKNGDPLEPVGLYDGRVVPAPAVDYAWDITEYMFDKAGAHSIVWQLGDLTSNTLTIEVTK